MDRSLIRLFASLVVLFALTSVAHALQLDRTTTKQGTILTLSGEFVTGDANKVLDALSPEPIMEVRLHSPGGNMKAGIDVGVTLRAAQDSVKARVRAPKQD